jgi:hypothetical protein
MIGRNPPKSSCLAQSQAAANAESFESLARPCSKIDSTPSRIESGERQDDSRNPRKKLVFL